MTTGWLQKLVPPSRYIQVILGTSVFIINSTVASYSFPVYNVLSTTAAALSASTILCGLVGLFAYYRRGDVHWHLTLAFDLLSIVASAAALLIDVFLAATWEFYYGVVNWACIAAAIMTLILLMASVLAATKTRALWLQARDHTEREGDVKHDWFHMVPPEDRPRVLDGRRAGEDAGADGIERDPNPV